jgi:4-hydroxy-tetrahydrodipicolinate reductase
VISIVLVGAAGRMGRAIETAAADAGDITIRARVGHRREGISAPVGPAAKHSGYASNEGAAVDELESLLEPGVVVVDFSSPEGFRHAVEACIARRVPMVSGSTGLGADDDGRLGRLAQVAPVIHAANFSLGVLALRRALAAALEAVPAAWDIEIIERHHRRKIDSPSGTALALAEDVASRRRSSRELRLGRSGRTGPRPEGEIGVHAVRGGSWVGDHTVLIAGAGETLELRHVAEDRGAFAHGALAAVRFIADARPGRYTLDDVVASKGRTL